LVTLERSRNSTGAGVDVAQRVNVGAVPAVSGPRENEERMNEERMTKC